MTANKYQIEALRTVSNKINEENILIDGALGLSGESGECADIIKKHLFQGHELDKQHLAKELGDVAWYIAVTAHAIGFDLDTIFQMNIDKLRSRYPDGFEAERSVNRENYN